MTSLLSESEREEKSPLPLKVKWLCGDVGRRFSPPSQPNFNSEMLFLNQEESKYLGDTSSKTGGALPKAPCVCVWGGVCMGVVGSRMCY